MTAPAINPVMNGLPGLAGGTATGMGGALAGFEALLAAMFGDTDIAGVPVGGKSAEGAEIATAPVASSGPLVAGLPVQTDMAAEPEPAEVDAEAEAAGMTPVDPALALAQAAATTTTTTPTAVTSDVDGQATTPVAADAPPAKAVAATVQPDRSEDTTETADVSATPALDKAVPTDTARAATPNPAPRHDATAPLPTTQPAPAALDAGVEASARTPAPAPASAPVPGPEAAATPAPQALNEASAREAITQAADAPPAALKDKKDKARATHDGGSEGDEAKAEGVSPRSGSAPVVAAASSGAGNAQGQAMAKGPKVEPVEPEARRMDGPDALEAAHGRPEARAAEQTSPSSTPAAAPVRGSPETVASLAAQIVKKLEGRATRFDVELDPVGLGKVDVRVEIGAHGRMTAALSFENPQAAADVKARSADLHRALEQAGFDVAGGALSFDVAGDRGQGQARQDWDGGQQQGAFAGRAFQQAMDTAGEADLAAAGGALRLRRGVTAGVDVRI